MKETQRLFKSVLYLSLRVSSYCERKGWRRIYNKQRDDFKLKWCETKSSANYCNFREGLPKRKKKKKNKAWKLQYEHIITHLQENSWSTRFPTMQSSPRKSVCSAAWGSTREPATKSATVGLSGQETHIRDAHVAIRHSTRHLNWDVLGSVTGTCLS